jgi:hypothetical protein
MCNASIVILQLSAPCSHAAAAAALYCVTKHLYAAVFCVLLNASTTDMLMKMKKRKVVTLIYQHWTEAVSLVMKGVWGVWEVCSTQCIYPIYVTVCKHMQYVQYTQCMIMLAYSIQQL